MQTQRPFALIASSVSGDALAVLARAEAAFTPPEVHRLIGDHSVDGVRKALKALVAQGTVLAKRHGQATTYELNRSHLAAPHIIAIARLSETLVEALSHELEGWGMPCTFAWLFGSAAQGLMRPDSDIDLLVVRPNAVDPDDSTWREQIDELEAKASAWTGNDARTLEYGERDLRAGLRSGDSVLAEVASHGIRLAGPVGYLRPGRAKTDA